MLACIRVHANPHCQLFSSSTLPALLQYNHPREELNRRLGIAELAQAQQGAVPHSYYAFQPAPGWRFLALDGYDVSILGWPPGGLRGGTAVPGSALGCLSVATRM